MRLKDYQTAPILNELRTFNYQTKVEGEEVTVNVELFPASMLGIANAIFLQKQGDLRADEIMAEYLEGEVTAADIADIIKTTHVQKWKHWLEMWKAEYNPIWNVDGTETHTIVTQYGKVTTQEKDTQVETEYNSELETEYNSELETEYDSSSKTTYNSNNTVEQLTDGKYNTTHGHVVTMTEPTTTNQVSAFDSVSFVNQSQTSATQHSDTNSGTDQIAISDGKKKTDRGGYDEISRDGKDTNSHTGKDTNSHTGKDTIKNTGVDTDRNSGTDTVTDTLVRGGNIGVTMTQQLLTAEQSFWSQYSFFDMWYSDIAEELTVPIYE